MSLNAGGEGDLVDAGTFVLFGVTDFVEMHGLWLGLIAFKGLVLVTLLGLRMRVLRRYYPASKTY